MSVPAAPIESLKSHLAMTKRSGDAAAKQAAIVQRKNERRQAAYSEFTAAFDAIYDFGSELIGRPKREVVIETNGADWLHWVNLWRSAAEHLTDKMNVVLRDVLSAKLPQLLGIAVQVLLLQSTESDEALADELRELIEDPGSRDFVEWLPWLKDELHPPILIFSDRHQCYRVPEHAGMPFWVTLDDIIAAKAAFPEHGGTADGDNVATRACSDFAESQTAGQITVTPVDDGGLAKYQDPLTPLGKRILKVLWRHPFAVQFETLRVEAWEGDIVSEDGIKRRLQAIEQRWNEAGLNDIDLEISPATTSVKLVKPLPKTSDKKGDN